MSTASEVARGITKSTAVPDQWECTTISALVRRGGNIKTGPFGTLLKASEYSPEGVPVVSVGEIGFGTVDIRDDTPRVPQQVTKRLPEYRLNKGDIVFGRKGAVERSALIRTDQDGWFLGSDGIRLRLPEGIVPEYLIYQLQTRKVRDWLMANAVGTTMASLNQGVLGRVPVLIPPTKDEQREIAAALADVDELVGALDKLIEKKRGIKLATMQQLMSGKVRLKGFTGGWRETTWGEVIAGCASGSTPSRARPDYYRGNIPWITSGELNYKVITDTVEKINVGAVRATNLKIVPAGTFLMAITGLEAEGTRGSCGIVGIPATTNQSCMAVYPKPELLSAYLVHFYVWRGKVLALQYCQGTKQQSYTAAIVKKLPITFPIDTEEQKAIATALSDMDAEISALEQRREKTTLIKKGMMQVLLTGKVRLV